MYVYWVSGKVILTFRVRNPKTLEKYPTPYYTTEVFEDLMLNLQWNVEAERYFVETAIPYYRLTPMNIPVLEDEEKSEKKVQRLLTKLKEVFYGQEI